MPDLQEMLRDITANPQAMQQLMSLAQSLGGGGLQPPQNPGGHPAPQSSAPAPQPQQNPMQLMQNLMQLSNQASSLDQRQLALIRAIKPFLTPDRAEKLDRAIQVANISRMASSSFRQMGSQTPESR